MTSSDASNGSGGRLVNRTTASDTCLIVHPALVNAPRKRSVDDQINEITGLAQAICLEVVDVQRINLSKIQAGSFLGKGQRSRIGETIKNFAPDILIFNYALSPVQQRNLEREWNIKVIDRTGLILEIFGARAQTKEGRLQVELAALDYQRSRLVRSWTHLERQRGGAGFMGGPGETQIELDRRIISDRIVKLKKELENVRKTRDLGRKARGRVPFPVVALVGYTNAGKSTLFNALTGAEIFAEDLLFATLDPTMRKVTLPNGHNVILSDTVGFISDLPTHLVAAFRATLEEVLYADVILHVVDVSSHDYEAQKSDVIGILKELGIDYEADDRIIEVYNKIDCLDDDRLDDLVREAGFNSRMSLVSALASKGLDGLLAKVQAITTARHFNVAFEVPYADGKALSWLYEHGEILERQDLDSVVACRVRLDKASLEKFKNLYGYSCGSEQGVSNDES